MSIDDKINFKTVRYLAIASVIAFVLFVAHIATAEAETVDSGLFPTTNYNCTVPTQREDNTAFDWATEGDVIRFYWGEASGDYQNIVERPACQWVIDNVAFAGRTIYFVSTAVDTDGRESKYNPETVYTVTVIADPKQVTGGIFEHIPAN